MSLATKAQAAAAKAIGKLGSIGTLTYPARTYDEGTSSAGSATTTVAVRIAGPVQETQRYIDAGTATVVAATFYVEARDLAQEPSAGDRVSLSGRTWSVVAVETIGTQGVAAVYRCDVGEVVDG